MAFPCPTQSSTTTQPTPPPQPPTTDDIRTPPPPTQQPVEPTDITVNSDRDGGTDPRMVTTTGVGPRLPITSESVTDGRISMGGTNIGLIIGIIITVSVLIAVTLTVVIIVVVIKKHRENVGKEQSKILFLG